MPSPNHFTFTQTHIHTQTQTPPHTHTSPHTHTHHPSHSHTTTHTTPHTHTTTYTHHHILTHHTHPYRCIPLLLGGSDTLLGHSSYATQRWVFCATNRTSPIVLIPTSFPSFQNKGIPPRVRCPSPQSHRVWFILIMQLAYKITATQASGSFLCP